MVYYQCYCVLIMNSTIQVKKATKTRLEKFGNLSSTYDTVLNEILDHLETCDVWWSNRS